MIYFLRPRDESPVSVGGSLLVVRPVKIGYAVHMRSRLKALADLYRRDDLVVEGVIPGGILTESAMHARFDDIRCRYNHENGNVYPTEWFYPARELLEFVQGETQRLEQCDAHMMGTSLRFSDRDAMILEAIARRCGTSPEEFVRSLVIDYMNSRPNIAYPFATF